MNPPATPKIYHIVHVDRLRSIVTDRRLWCDAEAVRRARTSSDMGTTIGMDGIKKRRLTELTLSSHPELYVGQCVPFYFCPRSIMLFVIECANHPELTYRGGQEPIIHIESDLRESVAWADRNQHRWAFTLSNAGSNYFEDRADLACLSELDWDAINSRMWTDCKDGKQAEFLIEGSFPWELVHRIGVRSPSVQSQVRTAMQASSHQPRIEILPNWYY